LTEGKRGEKGPEMRLTGVSRIIGPEPPEGLDGDARKGSVVTSEVAK
jgi:hypothetical protein